MSELLQEQVAVITGGASGLGRATAELMVEHGARVVVADVNDRRGAETVQALEAAGGKATFVHADVTSSTDVRAAVQAAEDIYGRLDIMVANAGILGTASTKALEDIEDEEFDFILDVNLLGVWRAFKYAIPALRRAGGGSMTSTGSLAGVQVLGGAPLGAYTASKAATCALTSFLAVELARDKIRVNCVSPGGMSTDIGTSAGATRANLAALEQTVAPRPPRPIRAFGESSLPSCDPREVAQLHLFLNSPLASFITGQVIVADGGGFVTTFAGAFARAMDLSQDV